MHGRVIVSAQAAEGEPLCAPEHICALAISGLMGGAGGLRLEGPENIRYVRSRTNAPIIGLIKSNAVKEGDRPDRVYITATRKEAEALAACGADIIALDATGRPRPDGSTLAELVQEIKERWHLPVWADISTLEEGLAAARLGADVVSTTLYGYTRETMRPPEAGPDFHLLEELCKRVDAAVVLEGRVWHPKEVARAFQLGATAVVVGSAITRPQLITRRFVRAVPPECLNRG